MAGDFRISSGLRVEEAPGFATRAVATIVAAWSCRFRVLMRHSHLALSPAAALPVHADRYLDHESSRLSFMSEHCRSQSQAHCVLSLRGQIAADLPAVSLPVPAR